MKFEEKKVNSSLIYAGKILNLECDEVILPDGNMSVRECVRHSGGAAVLLIDDGKVLLVKQFRYLYSKEIYEIPAGKLNKGEDGKIAATRELEEETGYRAQLEHFVDVYPSPGYTDEIIRVYRAVSCEFVGQRLDNDEFLTYEFIPLRDVLRMIEDGIICDSKTIISVYKYLLLCN